MTGHPDAVNERSFDEDAYLAKYGDVKQAVNDGLFSSGYAHYTAFGKSEGRSISNESAPVVAASSNNSADHDGAFYQHFLRRMHALIEPKTYFEIGTLHGETLKLAKCPSISVDPLYQIDSNVIVGKPACYFFQEPSDEFFAKRSPESLFGAKIDFAFLDGMHLFEYLLRDFFNTERYCKETSIIVLHDCLPLDAYMTVRNPNDPERQKSCRPGYWTGDVWKMIPILRRWRPDLKLTVLDAPPTGLTLVTNLDPGNSVLKDNYDRILDEYSSIDLGTYDLERLQREAQVVSTERFTTPSDFAALIDAARA